MRRGVSERGEEARQADEIHIGDADVVGLDCPLADAIVAVLGAVDRSRRVAGGRLPMLAMTDLNRTAQAGADDQEANTTLLVRQVPALARS
jgi:hypothetical protein